MPTYQTGRNVRLAYYPEVTFNTPPGAGTSYKLRANASEGMNLARVLINPGEIRSDGMTAMPRLGSRSVAPTYEIDASVGSVDVLLEAGIRGTWVAAVSITEATAGLTSVTTGANTIVASAGSWLTAGVRVGDVLRATGLPDAANNGRNLRVTGVSALTLTVAETLIVNAVADTSFTITIARKLTQPAVPVRRSFTFDEYEQDTDLTAQGTGLRVSSLRFAGTGDSMKTIGIGLVGANVTPLASGASPYFTSPSATTSMGLTLVDASIRYAGADVTHLTAFDMTYDMRAQTLPVIGSTVTPDVFENPATINGSISGARADMQNLSRYVAETELELHILAVEPESEPKDFISLFLPRIKLTSVSRGFGQDGAMIETMNFTAGPKEGVTGYDTTMIHLATSAT